MIIWLASYPKSGNTWLRSIISALLYSKNGDFDFELLKKVISESSFEKVYESSFNESKNIMLKIDDPGRRWESLYVEAVK